MDIAATTVAAATRPGKSAQAVGHLAKAAVAEARAAGVDLPKNAQGLAASAIARGTDPGSVFAALVAPEPASDTGETGTGTTDAGSAGDTGTTGGNSAGDTTAPVADAEAAPLADAGYAAAAGILGDSALNEAETALTLLQDAV